MIRLLLRDIAKYLPAQIVPAFIGLISIPIITCLFAPGEYGNYTLVMATVVILATLLGWLPMSIIRFYPIYEKSKKLNVFYWNIINLNFISIFIVTVVFLLSLYFIKSYISPRLYFLLHVGVGVLIFTGIFDVFQYFLRSMRKVNWYSNFAIWKSIVGFGLGLGLIIFFRLGIESLLWGAILSMAIALPLLWKKATESVPIRHTNIKPFLVREMAKYSFPLVVGNLAAWILNLSDRYILEIFQGSRAVGIYSASYNIADRSIMLIVTLVMLASRPILMNIWEKEGEVKSKEFVSKVTRYYLMGGIPAVIGVSVLAKPIMLVLTGQQYHEGYKVIPLVALGALFVGLQHRFQNGFLFYKKTGFITFAIAISGLLNLGLNFLFVPKYGYIAAAATTFISYVFLLFLMVIGSNRIFAWKFPFKTLMNSIYASAVMGMIIYFISDKLTSLIWLNLVLALCLGGIVYVVLLLLLREFQPEEKDIIKKVFVKYWK